MFDAILALLALLILCAAAVAGGVYLAKALRPKRPQVLDSYHHRILGEIRQDQVCD